MLYKIKHLSQIFLICILFSLTANYASNFPKTLPTAHYTTRKEAAAFALLIYHDLANHPPIPGGYTLLCECPLQFRNRNYYGEAYYRLEYMSEAERIANDPYAITVVIVHRGTLLNIDNLMDDFLIAIKNAPEAFIMSSKPFTDYVIGLVDSQFQFKKRFYSYRFIHIGHSLGAIHAELNAAYQQQFDTYLSNGSRFTASTTFESPGSKEIIQGLIAMNMLPENSVEEISHTVEIINSDVNLINSFNHQVSGVWRISPGYHFTNIPNVNLSPIDLKYFSTFFTIDQHSMANIYNYFQYRDAPQREPFPVGITTAFRYYKTYCPESNSEHMDYWDQAFQVYWNNHGEIHAEYNNDFEKYRRYMVKHHLIYWDPMS